ncbi:MAG TPA: class I SAM-dependent methyltransferase [Candidatus Methylomirabilis sp.]|nr:class I SAM-dependent methyltransferase [Candidatus Methylomirabilis sp.]
MYSLSDYGNMIADGWRFAAYAQAIATAVRPGDAVAEIGCGPGVFSLLACQAGARRVYAIESEDSIQFARTLAAANGFADRIEFIQNDSRKAELPERVNIIVSDIRGTLPFSGSAAVSIEDARRRFLAPGGILIPQKDTLQAAVVEAREYYEGLIIPWKNSADGLDLSPSLAPILNETYSVSFKSSQLLSEPLDWHVLNYAEGATPRASTSLHFRTARNGTAHGLCLWFETQLFDTIGFCSGPGGASTIYGQLFLPWLEPMEVVQGQDVEVELHANPVGREYVWRWETKIVMPGHHTRHFQQCTFQGANFARRSLQRQSADFVPQLSETGEAERWLLQAIDGQSSLKDIAQQASKRFPREFSGWEEAFRRAAELSAKFSR